jgi:DNA primase
MTYDKTIFEAVVNAADLQYEVEARMGKLKRVGNSMQGCCPFHAEKSPSFSLSSQKNMWKCFGCGESGDVISFVAKYDKISPMEAMRLLATRYNIPMPEATADVSASDIQDIAATLKIAAIKFTSSLLNNKEVKRYIVNRGITSMDMVKHWNLGYAPMSYELDTVKKIEALAGLHNSKGDWLFRDRIMFPIEDITGRILGFTARSIIITGPKYLNSPETALFHKSKALYGIRQAIASIKSSKMVVITEGPFDVIALHANNVTSAVGTCGTAFTKEHAEFLKRYCDKALCFFDGDKAGRQATIRAIENLFAAGFKGVEVAILPEGKDAADVASNLELVTDETAMEFLSKNIEADDEEEKINAILSIISRCPTPIRRDILIRELADLTNYSQFSLIEQLNQVLSRRI